MNILDLIVDAVCQTPASVVLGGASTITPETRFASLLSTRLVLKKITDRVGYEGHFDQGDDLGITTVQDMITLLDDAGICYEYLDAANSHRKVAA